MKTRLSLYLIGDKSSVITLIMITTTLGYFLGITTGHNPHTLIATLIGTCLSASGASVLNQVVERDYDALMNRTKNRPIPRGAVSPGEALFVGVLLVCFSVTLLAALVNLLTAFLALMTCFLYVCVYTPMKRVHWSNTIIGALPGALPALGGWSAATGTVSLPGWLLFFIVFLWQHPHFYAIAWMLREDYERGGFRMLPSNDPDGSRTNNQIAIFTGLLALCSLAPCLLGWAGLTYALFATAISLIMIIPAVRFAQNRDVRHARRILLSSLLYLPAILLLIGFEIRPF